MLQHKRQQHTTTKTHRGGSGGWGGGEGGETRPHDGAPAWAQQTATAPTLHNREALTAGEWGRLATSTNASPSTAQILPIALSVRETKRALVGDMERTMNKDPKQFKRKAQTRQAHTARGQGWATAASTAASIAANTAASTAAVSTAAMGTAHSQRRSPRQWVVGCPHECPQPRHRCRSQ